MNYPTRAVSVIPQTSARYMRVTSSGIAIEMGGTNMEVIDGTARLQEFRAEWASFAHALSHATPFQTPEWLLTWWVHFGGGKPHVMVVRDEGALAGIVPCFLHDWNGRRQLTLIGTGISDYLDPLIDCSHAIQASDSILSHLSHWSEWEVCDWQDLSADTTLRLPGKMQPDTACTRIPIVNSFASYLAQRPKDLKRNLRRDRRAAEAVAPLRFTVTPHADPDLLTALIDLHAARWRSLGETGTIEANRASGFLRDAAAALAACGMLRIFALYFRERVAAVILAFCMRTTLFGYLSGFDPQFEQFSPGRELLLRTLEFAHNNGYRYWDFLRGEEAYKFDWGAQPFPKCRLVLERRALVSAIPAAGDPLPSYNPPRAAPPLS